MTTRKPFLALTAEDLMNGDVVTIAAEMPLQAAAHLLSREQISGVPVVDAQGRCVGVLSATDFVRWADTGGRGDKIHSTRPDWGCSDWQLMDLELLPRDEVGRHMSADPVLASPRTRIDELARMMLDAHIHRVIVADADQKPIGVVSSTDILAAVAYAASHRHGRTLEPAVGR
jgi:CBS domain-containing protein